ncbi:hypothetical protein GOBAR_AA04117 [Gossypium barbadense]|uniref:RNase H type-1 domain-containing protein n=1 Tax=Gossypium barbadense TaxID=3634 RepID=A0A2P5YLK1_GOSBA|nr:hypothetical protein GOBAR_AA04117 [Gossypium barbadense]
MDSVIEANPIDTQVNPLNDKNNPSDIETNLPHNIRNPLSAENFTISIFTTTITGISRTTPTPPEPQRASSIALKPRTPRHLKPVTIILVYGSLTVPNVLEYFYGWWPKNKVLTNELIHPGNLQDCLSLPLNEWIHVNISDPIRFSEAPDNWRLVIVHLVEGFIIKCAGSVGKPGSWLEHAAAAGGRDHTGNLAWELRPRKIILETDSIAIVREVRRLLKMQWEARIQHT